jgi:hypothetical protein
MENSARVRINLSSKELEVEGSEQFVKEYAQTIETMLSALTSSKPVAPISPGTGIIPPGGSSDSGIPMPFGEYLHSFPSSITDVDKVLIAGYYFESQSADKSFTTTSARELLQEQSIKVGNPSACVTKNKNAKRVYVKTKGIFRVSQEGITYIDSLHSK